MLEAKALKVTLSGRPILQGLDFTLEAGQWLMVAGPNGAGKSTLTRACSGVLPYEGSLRLGGREIRSHKPRQLARRMAVLCQRQEAAYDFTVEQAVAMGRYAHQGGLLNRGDSRGPRAIEEALAFTGLEGMKNRLLSTLSGGESQRVFLAQALCQEPELLVLDEPANHLDLPFVEKLFEMVDTWRQKPGRAVMCVVHDLTLAKNFGTHALLIREGRQEAFGTVQKALTPEHLQRAYAMDVYGFMRRQSRVWLDTGTDP